MVVALGQGHIVLDGDPAPPRPNRGTAPNFRPMSIVAKRLDGSRCHLVWWQASAQATLCYMGSHLPHKRGHSPQFSAHVCCGQTTGWIKMPLGTGNIGLMRTQLHPPHLPQRARAPHVVDVNRKLGFFVGLLRPNRIPPAKLTYKRHVVGMSTSALK